MDQNEQPNTRRGVRKAITVRPLQCSARGEVRPERPWRGRLNQTIVSATPGLGGA
jgi:hypothetical protein